MEDAPGACPAAAVSALAPTGQGAVRLGRAGFAAVTEFTSFGPGGRGVVGGRVVLVGSARLPTAHGVLVPDVLEEQRAQWQRSPVPR